jgi:purine-nucleoside phosphorylase
MRTPNGLLLAGFCRRWREGAISVMVHGFGVASLSIVERTGSAFQRVHS